MPSSPRLVPVGEDVFVCRDLGEACVRVASPRRRIDVENAEADGISARKLKGVPHGEPYHFATQALAAHFGREHYKFEHSRVRFGVYGEAEESDSLAAVGRRDERAVAEV